MFVLLKAELEDMLIHHPTQHWLDLLLPAGIPCAPINNVEQAVHDPQVQARNMVLPVDDPSVAPLMVAGMPIKMSAYPDAVQRARGAGAGRRPRPHPRGLSLNPHAKRVQMDQAAGLLALLVLVIARGRRRIFLAAHLPAPGRWCRHRRGTLGAG